jgi:hypothetical protein
MSRISTTPGGQATPAAAVTLTYFAYFDIGEAAGDIAVPRLQQLANAPSSSILHTYDISTDVLHSQPQQPGEAGWNILEKYRDDMYSSRIAPYARKHRFGQMYQLRPFSVASLRADGRTLHAASERIQCQAVVSLTNLGLGCIQLWMRIPGRHQLDELIHFNDPTHVEVTSVDIAASVGDVTATLRRNTAFVIDVLSFCAVTLLAGIGLATVLREALTDLSTEWRRQLISAPRAGSRETTMFPSFDNVETYSLYHFDFSGTQPDVTAAELQRIADVDAHVIRALITNDANWRVKRDDVVKKALERATCTTRDSILWYVTPHGAAKLYAKTIETDQRTSMVLATFELEMLLGMRFFLMKINHALNGLALDRAQPTLLATVHRSMIERMDSFFSFANCTKDTTAERLDRLKDAFGIARLSAIAHEKIEVISSLVAAQQDRRIQGAQRALTIVFGVFGVAQVLLPIFIWFDQTPRPATMRIVQALLFVGASMVLVGAGLQAWLRRRE